MSNIFERFGGNLLFDATKKFLEVGYDNQKEMNCIVNCYLFCRRCGIVSPRSHSIQTGLAIIS